MVCGEALAIPGVTFAQLKLKTFTLTLAKSLGQLPYLL